MGEERPFSMVSQYLVRLPLATLLLAHMEIRVLAIVGMVTSILLSRLI
jgi:hypothetical protein